MSIIWTGLAPHPPIIIKEVGGVRCDEARATINGMQAMCSDMLQHKPERLIIVSPHAPRPTTGISSWAGESIQGNLAQFGAATVKARLPVDRNWMESFVRRFVNVSRLAEEELDHGSMVPLMFAIDAGWKGKTCILGLPWDSGGELDRMGEALAHACNDEVPTAVIASGDMSHCLKPEGPYGYDPVGPAFDALFVELIKACRYPEVASIDPVLREGARQDVVESCRVVWSATDYRSNHNQFFSYEGPFGVGYSVMKFFGERN